MRILFSTDSLARGGKERQMAILAKALIAGNHELIFVAKRTDRDNNYFGEYSLSQGLIRTYSGYSDFRMAVSEFRPDLMVSWDAKSSFFGLLLYRRLRFTFINGSIRHGIREWKPDHVFRTVVCHLSPWVIANSQAGLRVNFLKAGQSRFVLRNGVEKRFGLIRTAQEREELRSEMVPGYREKPSVIFLSVANFVPYKDYFTIFRALARIKKREYFRYLIAGDGPMKGEITSAIRENDLEENVSVLGRRYDISDLMQISDVFIHSSKGEGISNAILEAMQAGLPVIATDVGGVSETVYPATSRLFPFGDEEVLARYLAEAFSSPWAGDMNSPGYREHLEKFSVERMLADFLQIMRLATGVETNGDLTAGGSGLS